jgi:hypothetical protein
MAKKHFTKKTPGSDGFVGEGYKIFKEEILHKLLPKVEKQKYFPIYSVRLIVPQHSNQSITREKMVEH